MWSYGGREQKSDGASIRRRFSATDQTKGRNKGEMLKRFQEYVTKKRLEANTEKIKMMAFREGRRKKKIERKLDNERIEAVKAWKYFGVWMRFNNNREEHVRNVSKKAVGAFCFCFSIFFIIYNYFYIPYKLSYSEVKSPRV